MTLSLNSSPDQIIKEGFQQVVKFAPAGTENIVEAEVKNIDSYGALVDRLDGPAHLAGDPAQKVAAATLYGFLEKAGIDPNEWKLTVDPVVAGQVKYGPEEFNQARKFLGSWSRIAEIALIIAIAASFVIAGVAVYLAGAALTAITTALVAGAGITEVTAILNIAKFRGIKWLSVPAAILAMGTAVAYFSSTQITAVGDLETYVKQGVARGEELATKQAALLAGGGTIGSDLPKTIIRMVTEEKPKQFIGTLFSSKLGKAEQFERVLDDKITDMNDLEADVKINLNKWLASLPNRMGYSVVVRKDPVDEQGAQQSGVWATLTLFMTHISGKTTPIDTILLGPVDPKVRLELQRKTTTVENQIAGFVQAATVREIQIPTGSVDIFSASGERVLPSTVATGGSAPGSAGVVTGAPIVSGGVTLLMDKDGLVRTGEGSAVSAVNLSTNARLMAEDFARKEAAKVSAVPTPTPVTPPPPPAPVVPRPPKAEDRYKVANTGGEGANLRGSPSTSARVLFAMPDNTVVAFLKDEGFHDGFNWWEVRRISDNSNGSVASKFLVRI